MFENLSSKQLVRAARLKEQIENLENELNEILGSSSSGSSAPAAFKSVGKGPISSAGLARIKEAQRLRWSKYRKEKGITTNGSAASPSSGKPKRTMSAAAKAKIRAAAKARWAKAKAAGRTSL